MKQDKDARLFKNKDITSLAAGTGPQYEEQFRKLHKLMTQKQDLSHQLNYLKNELKMPLNVIMNQFEEDDSLESINVGEFTISVKTIKYNGISYLWAE